MVGLDTGISANSYHRDESNAICALCFCASLHCDRLLFACSLSSIQRHRISSDSRNLCGIRTSLFLVVILVADCCGWNSITDCVDPGIRRHKPTH